MAKAKKPARTVENRPIYSRISYLYQAAAYLAAAGEDQQKPNSPLDAKNCPQQAMSRRLVTDMRSTSLKTQIRLAPALKHTICKFCDTLLVGGDTCTSVVENQSKGAKKPWADVLVLTCQTCGGLKRFPLNAARQKRRPLRESVTQKPEQAPAAQDNTRNLPVVTKPMDT
jgi:ribonuclease P protein subunit RPR2